jgi:hypothetical protein
VLIGQILVKVYDTNSKNNAIPRQTITAIKEEEEHGERTDHRSSAHGQKLWADPRAS